MARPGPARSDRGRRTRGYRRLVEDASAFAQGALSLPLGERRQLAAVFGRDIPHLVGGRDAAIAWLASEVDQEVAASLQAALLRSPRAYLEGETLWIVHGKGDALSVRESGVAYHPRLPASVQLEDESRDLRDEAARRLWAHRGELPADARRFAGFF